MYKHTFVEPTSERWDLDLWEPLGKHPAPYNPVRMLLGAVTSGIPVQ